jgi:hypothetical protein
LDKNFFFLFLRKENFKNFESLFYKFFYLSFFILSLLSLFAVEQRIRRAYPIALRFAPQSGLLRTATRRQRCRKIKKHSFQYLKFYKLEKKFEMV